MLFPRDCIRVLVIDDEVAIADSLTRILRGHGFDAMPEYSARGAVVAASKFDPDVLITDIVDAWESTASTWPSGSLRRILTAGSF